MSRSLEFNVRIVRSPLVADKLPSTQCDTLEMPTSPPRKPTPPPRKPAPPTLLALPPKCVTASALRSLANALDRLAAFHHERGGPAPDAPCLTEVAVDAHDGISARVHSGDRKFRLVLVRGAWEFR